MQDFRFTLPIPSVNGLGRGAETIKGMGLSDMGNFILDVVRETAVEDVVEGAITIAMNLSSEAIELYDILVDLLSLLHGQVVQLVFHVSDGIMWAEIVLQFRDNEATLGQNTQGLHTLSL